MDLNSLIYAKIVYSRIKGLSAESKMLLIFMCRDMSPTQNYSKRLIDMVEDYGFSRTQIVKSKKQLLNLGVIVPNVKTDDKRSRGRQVSSYQIEQQVLDSLIEKSSVELSSLALSRIRKLIRSKSILAPGCRMLATILVGVSNGVGTVDNVGVVEIAHWMGCTEKRVQSMVKKLKQMETIKHYIPGVCHHYLGKCKAVYFLDLQTLGIKRPQGTEILFSEGGSIVSLVDVDREYHRNNKPKSDRRTLGRFAYYVVLEQQLTHSLLRQIDYKLEVLVLGLINCKKISKETCIEDYRNAITTVFERLDITNEYQRQLLEFMVKRAIRICHFVLRQQDAITELSLDNIELSYKSPMERFLVFFD
ncbi:hypothetical protein BH582_00520 [Vibrio sp. 10N.222.47.A9]|uniref:hypothetical protein n=1 Tax=Vibrio sp. 10N.222.47.A9 TaxID=1903178 RepID=UPI000977DECC|nr:hypothetical protein [Vibrio sp. 10N.222.47.A9]OMO34616.1 hypothetical protein BH582_00520 [Vibrio sp. 10N.222.47.A9]